MVRLAYSETYQHIVLIVFNILLLLEPKTIIKSIN